MPNKTIHLDERTAIIAGRMTNFSAWVRRQLVEYARDAHIGVPDYHKDRAKPHVAPQDARVWGDNNDKCNPKHKNGLCEICYGDA